ncbi:MULTISPECIES: hypothetical protein [unclassified Variovorax]|uniref:hypothetical protein n=1 Tax=unclassified Variovorax TaxID=663243 RepID=UPI002575A9F6|nr:MULTISPECIES: hypothetical protein [unclassified Variovorax]MDM0086011.1 hypothetical protein [Variovorax sp. J22G40]MDM0145732.1 hypothetical protein [Variovorax sp. J2P1-31]
MRRVLRPTLLSLGLLAFVPLGHAACESGLAERIHARLHPDRALDERLAACKPWPAFPGRIVIVLPMPRPVSDPSATKVYDLEVLLVQRPDNGNTERDTLVSRLFQAEAMDEDGVAIQEIKVDTARYVLASDARAFGLRVRYRGTTHADAFASETLRLYVAQGGKLREVLQEIELDSDSGEWNADCTGRFRQLRTMLSTRPGRNGAFADLVLSRTRTQSRAQVQDDGSCAEKAQPPQYSTVVLRYDGERFKVPKSVLAP